MLGTLLKVPIVNATWLLEISGRGGQLARNGVWESAYHSVSYGFFALALSVFGPSPPA